MVLTARSLPMYAGQLLPISWQHLDSTSLLLGNITTRWLFSALIWKFGGECKGIKLTSVAIFGLCWLICKPFYQPTPHVWLKLYNLCPWHVDRKQVVCYETELLALRQRVMTSWVIYIIGPPMLCIGGPFRSLCLSSVCRVVHCG